MNARPGPIGIFGGTFDPVHNGHLRAALEVLEACQLAELRLVPVGLPPHRPPPAAPAALRLRMLREAVADEARLVVDDRELRCPDPSYTVNTLLSLRAEVDRRPLCLMVGADAFQGLPGWHRWREIIDLAHLIVVQRPGALLAPQGELAEVVAERRCGHWSVLAEETAGRIYVQTVTQLAISASKIRQLLAQGRDPRWLMPAAVRRLVMESDCYRSGEQSMEVSPSAN